MKSTSPKQLLHANVSIELLRIYGTFVQVLCYISTGTAQLVMSLGYITALSTLQPTDLAHSAGEGEGS